MQAARHGQKKNVHLASLLKNGLHRVKGKETLTIIKGTDESGLDQVGNAEGNEVTYLEVGASRICYKVGREVEDDSQCLAQETGRKKDEDDYRKCRILAFIYLFSLSVSHTNTLFLWD